MAYLFSLAKRATNNIIAPVRVAFDKSYDIFVVDEPDKSSDKSEKIINVDGLDEVPRSKKVERMFTQTNIIIDYVHFFSNPTEIFPGIYLGSANNAANWETLTEFNIKYIVNVSLEISNYHEGYGITYYRIPIRDNNMESIQGYFKESFEKIDEFKNAKNGNILIHCFMGASRSATIAANYIAKKTETDITDVIDNLKKRRPIVNPTQQFVRDLIVETQ